MDASVAADALYAYGLAWAIGDADHFGYAITDFSLYAGERRQWVLDMATGEVLWNLFVPHGEGSSSASNPGYAVRFSDTNNSHQSSLGMMRAGEVYTGSFGYSMRLDGLENGYNGNVRSRAIVVHPWEGSRREYVDAWGYAADTWGCPALDDRLSADVIDFLADGGLLFFHYPDGDWSRNSSYLP